MPAMLEHFCRKDTIIGLELMQLGVGMSELIIQAFSKLETAQPSSHHELLIFSAVSPIV